MGPARPLSGPDVRGAPAPRERLRPPRPPAAPAPPSWRRRAVEEVEEEEDEGAAAAAADGPALVVQPRLEAEARATIRQGVKPRGPRPVVPSCRGGRPAFARAELRTDGPGRTAPPAPARGPSPVPLRAPARRERWVRWTCRPER